MQPLECVNPMKDKWRVRWDIRVDEDSNSSEYMEEDFDHKPTREEVKQLIVGWYNSKADMDILSGFRWNDIPVWLSTENQFNYKAAFDAALASNGKTLPVKFKFGTDEEPVYREFSDIDELSDFYYKSMAHVQGVLVSVWAAKDGVDYSVYE